MVVIRGTIEPTRDSKSRGFFHALFGRGRPQLEYVIEDAGGRPIGRGSFSARSNGHFALGLDTTPPASVEIRLKGRKGRFADYCRIAVRQDRDIVNLPRKLSSG
jgi:hypothetical protein